MISVVTGNAASGDFGCVQPKPSSSAARAHGRGRRHAVLYHGSCSGVVRGKGYRRELAHQDAADYEDYGRMLLARGDKKRTRPLLEQALSSYRALGMAGALARAESPLHRTLKSSGMSVS